MGEAERGASGKRAELLVPFDALADLGVFANRLSKGQQFNCYESHRGWQIGIGPVTDFIEIASSRTQDGAEAIVSALRFALRARAAMEERHAD